MPPEDGLLTICDPGADRPLAEIRTVRCVHCGGHFNWTPGSGRLRGFCQRCNGFVCGPGCEACVPMEQFLENVEHGRPADYVTQSVAVGISLRAMREDE